MGEEEEGERDGEEGDLVTISGGEMAAEDEEGFEVSTEVESTFAGV